MEISELNFRHNEILTVLDTVTIRLFCLTMGARSYILGMCPREVWQREIGKI